jgi:hypothetical protein
MQLPHNAAFALVLVGAFGVGLAAACEKKGSKSPDDGNSNLCTEYGTCDECIEGQQSKGNSLGEAETECGAAVTGCWTTWEKPVKCHGKEHKK